MENKLVVDRTNQRTRIAAEIGGTQMLSKDLAAAAKNAKKIIFKNSPHILTGLGCAGVITTSVMTGQATLKADKILATQEKTDAPILEKAKATWKCYISSGLMGAVSIGCIIGANTVNTRRNAALAALYSMSETALREYKSKVVEQIGKTKETKVQDAVAKDVIISNPSNGNIILTGKGDVLCYDMLSGRYFKSNYEFIRQKVNDVNYDLRSEMRLPLNHLYSALELPDIELGDMLGFDLEKGPIEPCYSTQLDTNGIPCLVFSVDVYPYF